MGQTVAERMVNYRQRQKAEGIILPGGAAKLRRRTPEEQEAAKQARNAAAKEKRRNRPFMAVDGEGAGVDEHGRQEYRLLRVGPAEVFRDNGALSTVDCLEAILAAPAEAILVGFAFGYDATMILRDMPDDRRQRLLDMTKGGEGAPSRFGALRYTYWGDYGIEYLPRNYLRICRTAPWYWPVLDSDGNPVRDEQGHVKHRAGRKIIKGSSRTIYDTFAFFQCSFVKALEAWDVGTEAQRLSIEAEKDRRAEFVTIGDTERQYCQLECVLLEVLMSRFRDVCYAADIVPATWNGAGKLSAAMHSKNKTLTREALNERTPPEVRGLASDAYYGGRFEVMRTGQVGRVYEYDIRSAYPAAMVHDLPCLEHATWVKLSAAGCVKRLENYDPREPFVAAVKFHHDVPAGMRPNLYGLPIRTPQRRLMWPNQGAGVYWSPEVKAALQLGCRPSFRGGWGLVRTCECQPFAWVEKVYQERLKLGSDGRGKVLKLGINGLYGKLAQRIGNPKYANMVHAGLITANTRARLITAAAAAPESVVMMATDAIYTKRQLAMPIGEQLGEWEAKEHKSFFVVQPGLYWGPMPKMGATKEERAKWKAKSRGISPGYFAKVDPKTGRPHAWAFEQAWDRWAEYMQSAGPRDFDGTRPPKVTIILHLFIGMRLAHARKKPLTAGAWVDRPYDIDFAWYAKRSTGHQPGGPIWETRRSVWHFPLPGERGPRGYSVPHQGSDRKAMEIDPVIDAMDLNKAEFEDMPDWIELGPVWTDGA